MNENEMDIYLSIYLSIEYGEMDKQTFRGQNDNEYSQFSFCQGRLQGGESYKIFNIEAQRNRKRENASPQGGKYRNKDMDMTSMGKEGG